MRQLSNDLKSRGEGGDEMPIEKASEEFELIENEGMIGLYYLMAKSLHDAGAVYLSEIVT